MASHEPFGIPAPNLWGLNVAMESLDNLLDDMEAGLIGSDDDEAQANAIREAMESLVNRSVPEAFEAAANYLASLEARAEMRKRESDRIASLAQSDNRRAERVKSMMKEIIERRKLGKVDTGLHIISIQNNGGVLPLTYTVQFDVNDLYRIFPQAVRFTPNNDVVRKLIQDGISVTGVEIGLRGTHIRIK